MTCLHTCVQAYHNSGNNLNHLVPESCHDHTWLCLGHAIGSHSHTFLYCGDMLSHGLYSVHPFRLILIQRSDSSTLSLSRMSAHLPASQFRQFLFWQMSRDGFIQTTSLGRSLYRGAVARLWTSHRCLSSLLYFLLTNVTQGLHSNHLFRLTSLETSLLQDE